jgi:hypothetical protein
MYNWINLHCLEDGEASTPTADLYNSYKSYLEKNNKIESLPVNISTFSKELQVKCPYKIENLRVSFQKQRIMAYKGIKLGL